MLLILLSGTDSIVFFVSLKSFNRDSDLILYISQQQLRNASIVQPQVSVRGNQTEHRRNIKYEIFFIKKARYDVLVYVTHFSARCFFSLNFEWSYLMKSVTHRYFLVCMTLSQSFAQARFLKMAGQAQRQMLEK